MSPNKVGQVVVFHTPISEEEQNQQFVVVELHLESKQPEVAIKSFETDVVETVLVEELEVVTLDTADLIGYAATIQTADNDEVSGTVLSAKEETVLLEMEVTEEAIITNVALTIKDKKGVEYSGFLLV